MVLSAVTLNRTASTEMMRGGEFAGPIRPDAPIRISECSVRVYVFGTAASNVTYAPSGTTNDDSVNGGDAGSVQFDSTSAVHTEQRSAGHRIAIASHRRRQHRR